MMEKTLKETYDIRKIRLKGLSYEDYLNSSRWASIKRLLYRKPKNRSCRKCLSTENLHFHHLTYRHINTDRDTKDIMTFCSDCHKKIHDLSKRTDLSVYKATIKFLGNIKTKKTNHNKKPAGIPVKEKTNAQIAHELNNEKLLSQLNKYKNYHKNNNSKPKSKRKNKSYKVIK